MSVKKKSQSTCFITLVLLILLMAGISGVYLAYNGLEQIISDEFGAPSSRLGLAQRIYYPIKLLLWRDDLVQPLRTGFSPVTFEINLGEGIDSIVTRLSEAGVISNKEAFLLYLVYKGLDTSIQAGSYSFQPGMSSIQIAYALQDATPEDVTFVILPGWRLEEIAASLPTSGLDVITPEAFLAYTQSSQTYQVYFGEGNGITLEGFLYPGEYDFKRTASVGDIVDTFISRFNVIVTPEMRQQYQNNGLTLYQAVTLASIIERESVNNSEDPRIASVFYNRLAAGMRLESDPTVQYAVGYQTFGETWWINPIRQIDLELDSPYNTYQYAGLPPSPICNPGIDALNAVAYPEITSYLYFRATCDGSGMHTFSVTFEEHQQNECP